MKDTKLIAKKDFYLHEILYKKGDIVKAETTRTRIKLIEKGFVKAEEIKEKEMEVIQNGLGKN